MPVYNIPQYRQLQKRRIEALQKNARRGKIRGAELYAAKLRLYVPINTGKLKRSIVRRGSVVRVGATGDGGFPYVHWINQTPGTNMTTLRFPRGAWVRQGSTYQKILPRGSVATYGLQPSNWQWTGRVRFAQKALYETRQQWQVLIQKINKKSIMVQSI